MDHRLGLERSGHRAPHAFLLAFINASLFAPALELRRHRDRQHAGIHALERNVDKAVGSQP